MVATYQGRGTVDTERSAVVLHSDLCCGRGYFGCAEMLVVAGLGAMGIREDARVEGRDT